MNVKPMSQTSGTSSKVGTGTNRSSQPPGLTVILRPDVVAIDRAVAVLAARRVVVRAAPRATETVVEADLAAETKSDRVPRAKQQLLSQSRLRARGRRAAKNDRVAMRHRDPNSVPRDNPTRTSSVRLAQHLRDQRRLSLRTMALLRDWMTNQSRVAPRLLHLGPPNLRSPLP